MSEMGFPRVPPDQSSGSGRSFGTPRQARIIDPILSKRVCFYKSGDPQFNGLHMVINNRTFKTFDALLDSLSKKVPLPFGVRNITTPRGVHAVHNLDELQDGKSYICSDNRKVKPINLALARKKPPPWYNARPVSSRRRIVQRARSFPGKNFHKHEQVFMRTPKKLLVFRNGDPTVKHTVVLHKRTTPSFKSILDYISELVQYQVKKLHTADGRRVDGLPGLILCSGTVVAVGREPFRHANYNGQKSPGLTTMPTKRTGPRRLRSLKRKKKSLTYSSKSRNFSSSSERYIVNRIHNSIAGSSSDFPSHSLELESSRMLESVLETPEGQESILPSEDDIEKSFRVNQDGSMTVEMKVRLTIKEEETIHWTTTLSRSAVANQLNETYSSEPDAEQEVSSAKSNPLELQSTAASTDTVNKDKPHDDNDDNPPSLCSGAFSESGIEEDDTKVHREVVSPRSAFTPGGKRLRKKQASVESITSVAAEGIQEDMVGSYSYREQTENGATTEQYCMVKQSSSRPVPKPRRLSSFDANNVNSRNVSTFKSAGLMSEILQIESNEEEVQESVLHVYEQQTYQEHYVANHSSHGMSTSGVPFCRPATSDTGQLSSSNELELQILGASSASESISMLRNESQSVSSDLTIRNAQQRFHKPTKSKDNPQQRKANKEMRVSTKPKVMKKRVYRLMSPGKRHKKTSTGATDKSKKAKTFSSAGFLQKIYGKRSKTPKSMIKLKKGPTQDGDEGNTRNGSQQSENTMKCIQHDQNIPSTLEDSSVETVHLGKSRLNEAANELSQTRGVLTRQTSMHQEKKNRNESYDVSKRTNEYVENWLEKAHLNPTAYPEEKTEAVTPIETQTSSEGEYGNGNGLTIVPEEDKCLEEKIQSCQRVKNDLLAVNGLRGSVKKRIQSFEIKSSSPSIEKFTPNPQNVRSHTTTNTEKCTSSAEVNKEQIILPQNHNENSVEMPSVSVLEKKSSPIQKATPSNILSMELPLPPPPADMTDLSYTEYSVMEASSAASSPLYRLSASSEMSENHILSTSLSSDKTLSPTDHIMETSNQADVPSTEREAPLRTPSIKRTPLLSNVSLDRTMSIRKACVDKYTLCSKATSETNTSSSPVHAVCDDVLPNAILLTGTLKTSESTSDETQTTNSILNGKSSQSWYASTTPNSSSSGERISPASISSCDTPTPSELEETIMEETQCVTKKEASSQSTLVRKGMKIPSPASSPFLERNGKIVSSELLNNSPKLPSLHSHNPDKMSSNTGIRRHGTPNVSPSINRKLYKPKSQKRMSPYSQSLDVMSPSVRHKSSVKVLSRNLSSDSGSEPTDNTLRQTTSQRNHPSTLKSTCEMDTTLTCDARKPLEADQTDENMLTDEEKSNMQIMPPPLNMANQPNMKPVLEKICYSIKSIRQITQNNRRSCLEKSNSLPDFSSHVASTFGSSTKALLAFLSVMTLKEDVTNLNMVELNANNVSCAEALRMIDSLREIASIEDSDELQVSLSNLQQSASKQLLQSWKGFQELKCKSETPSDLEEENVTQDSPEKDCGIDKNGIDEIVDTLCIPEMLKEELDSLSMVVKQDSDKEEDIEVEPKININDRISQFSTGDGADVRTVAQEEKVKVDVGSIIRKFPDITQPKASNTVSIAKDTKEDASQYGQDGVARCPSTEPIDKEIPNERYSSSLLVKDNWEQGHNEDQERAEINEVVSSKQSLTFEPQKKDKGNQMMMHSEESIPESELSHYNDSDEEGQNMSSALKDLELTVSCKQSASSSESGEQHNSEEEPEVEYEEILNENLNLESQSVEKAVKQPCPDYDVEVDVKVEERFSSPDSQQKSMSEEEQSEIEYQAGSIGLNVSFNESDCNSDDQYSEEEQPEVECKKLQVIIEENLSGNEAEEEEYLYDLPVQRGLKALIEETEEDDVSSDHHEEINLRNLIKNQDSYAKKDSSLINQCLTKSYGLNEDKDSGNDHSSSEELVEAEQPKVDHEQINCLNKSVLSFDVKEATKEAKTAKNDRYIEEICTEYKKTPELAAKFKVTTSEKAVEKLKHQFEEMISQSVTERVILLEKKVADAQKTPESSAIKRSSQRSCPLESDVENSPSISPTAPINRSPPQSSLSFSYDSSGVITSEPESNKVRLIREMFLAKNATDVHGRLPSLKTSDLSDLRAETSASAGYQSLTSSDLSSGEDDSARKSITKGFVRRTIERLYGKKEAKPDEEIERPPSATKQKTKDHSSIFSPFHIAKAVSELSYFNSSAAVETFNEAARCITFHAQVRPEEAIANEQWLLKENMLMKKSASDPVGINKHLTNSLQGQEMCEDTEDKTSHSLIHTQSEAEDKKETFTRKCTYFSLPHASDSEPCPEELSIVSAHGDSIIDTRDSSEDTKMCAERNGTLPSVTDFKKKDNKVHPLVEPSPDGKVVVLQPRKGQGVMSRRDEDPDVLDVLYNFCGQNCPIL